jgi:outer membrane protein OmpA-like peptidoglycan-associated protein
MRKLNIAAMTVLLCSVSLVFATIDHDPKNIGTSLTRNATGNHLDAPVHNPALLGVERAPAGGFLLCPITNLGLGYWSDKLALNPFIILANYPSDGKRASILTSEILKSSFGITDADLSDTSGKTVSNKLAKGMKGGVKLYGGARTQLLSFAQGRIAFDIMTHLDEEIQIPDGVLNMLFSYDRGLLPGNTLDLTKLRQEAIWATDIKFQAGLPVQIPALHKFFNLKYGAGGIGGKIVLGHSLLRTETKKGTLSYNSATNSLTTEGEMYIQSAGTGFRDKWDWKMPSIPAISGAGFGAEIGGILYDEKGSLTINIEDLGVLFWVNNVQEMIYRFKSDKIDVQSIIKAADEYGDHALEHILNIDTNQISYKFEKVNNPLITFLPLAFNMGYAYTWNFERIEKQPLRLLAEKVTLAANYQQQLAPGPGRSFIPRLSLGGEAGILRDYLPIRVGWVFGGPEILASNAGFGFNFKYFSFNAAYKALGNLIFWPQRGFEVAGGFNINWGMKTDTDRDGIVDKDDKCPLDPEDKDGFEDTDGCPDPDNDKDSLCDPWVSEKGQLDKYTSVCHGIDKCPNQPEDRDGFEDEDGCPDYDNDQDGIPDSTDKCPMEKEDKDNFQDQDGCPDYDNDGDGVPDSVDQCPLLPEDIDGFEDSDGCPDYDNDKDGIPDSIDQCINQPETFNGYKDEDGCPDTLAKPTEKETKALNTKLRAINFKTASAELTSDSYTALNFVVGFLKQYPYLRYEIQGHTDSQGGDDYNLLLSAARAGSVSNYLKSQGIADSSIIAIGYGETTPIAPNTTAAGRAQNRRVDFKIIETREQYNQMKQQEADFQIRIREAKIKGAGY